MASFMTSVSGILIGWDTKTHRQNGDRISLLLLPQIKDLNENRQSADGAAVHTA
jgi:hypothetical protein